MQLLFLFAPTVQVAEAFLVAFPQLVEVLGSIVTFLDDGPSTFWEKTEQRLSLHYLTLNKDFQELGFFF